MGKVLNDLDTIILEDNTPYIVVKTVDVDNSTYALLKELNQESLEKGSFDDNNEIIVEEIVNGDDVVVQPILNPTLLDIIKKKF